RRGADGSGGSGSNAPRKTPVRKTSSAHSASTTLPGSTRPIIQIASPSSITPNAALTVFIHGPAFGSSLPAEVPTTRSGAPMPRLNANSAPAPRTTSPLWPITASAATSGGATQVVTISADSAPITAVPANVPAFCRFARFATRVWMAAGICRLKTPNIDSASTTKRLAKSVMIQGFWKTACTCSPASAASAPATVYVNAMPSTYDSDSENARPVDVCAPWPAMMPERIGTIGSTQGVNESNRPRPKNVAPTRSHESERISAARRSCSETGASEALGGALSAGANADAAGNTSAIVCSDGG